MSTRGGAEWEDRYPDGLATVVDHPLEDTARARAEVALHLVGLAEPVLALEQQQHPAALALPAVVGEEGGCLVDFLAVVLDVDGALAEGAGDHEVLVEGLVGEAGLALPRGLRHENTTIRICSMSRRISLVWTRSIIPAANDN